MSQPTSANDKQDKSPYRGTLNLPRTSFPMKANLIQNEPASLKRWSAMNLYEAVRKARTGAPRFVFHDGPPYANGPIHLGHMLNKSLKDFVVRSRTMMGMDCPYVPGWDCHGLPIEHRVMTDMVESKKIDKIRSLPEDQRRMVIRRECQKHAEKFQKLQSGQMQRLLTLADYDHPYLTMSPEYEGATLEVLASLLEQGLVYRALKPVHWSVANETALAEAELEYFDREDTSVYVDFEADEADAVYNAFGLPPHQATSESDEDDVAVSEPGAPIGRPDTRPSFMIWTTTPWTLPANLAIAVHPDLVYALVFVDGNMTVMAEGAVERVTTMAKAEDVRVLGTCKGSDLIGLRYRHPFIARAADAPEPVFTIAAADYVTLEDGTGLVHTAPGHGQEDFDTGRRIGLPVYSPVRHDGTYDETVPEFIRGLDIWKANDVIVQNLRDSGHLYFDQKFTHSYPHDWRSKTPVIFRCTEQWFIGVDLKTRRDGKSLRDLALAATEKNVAFVPEWGRNRMRGMLESRPDWCISRQRSWGLPIPAFELENGVLFMTAASVIAIARLVREKGSDIWFTAGPAELLQYYNPAEDPEAPAALSTGKAALSTLRKGPDILDVWFESGSSWNAVMRERSGGADFPIELYLEGADQHRGWFQTSLLPSLGVMGQPAFRSILTHGFTVNREGRKLSKSKGDTIDELFAEYGVDVLRWWVASQSYESDMKVDRELFDLAGENYRKIRNTIRFMLSNLEGFTPGNEVESISPTTLEAWVLSEYDKLAKNVIHAYERYDFQAVHRSLYDFCNETLSSVYLAAIKDRLYCDRADSPRRRRTQAALHMLTDGLCRLLAPVLCHTADEAYRVLKGDSAETCIHLEKFLDGFGIPSDPAWQRVMRTREQALTALEKAKAAGVENPLDAGVVLPDADGQLTHFDPADLADLLGVSQARVEHVEAIKVLDLRDQPRCERSWKRDGTVRQRSDGGLLTDRDAEAVGVA